MRTEGALGETRTDMHSWLMVVENQALVWWIARKIYDSYRLRGFNGLELEDLVQEGLLGMQRAAQKFDPSVGCPFGMYAPWWIRQAILRAIVEKARLIRLPQEMIQELGRLNKVLELSTQQGIEPSLDQLAESLNCTVSRVAFLLALRPDAQSLDQPVFTGDEETSLSDLIAAPSSTQRQDERIMVAELLDYLLPMERAVIEVRYQIGPSATHDPSAIPLPFAEVTRQLGIGIEKAQRLEMHAFLKMRYRAKMLAFQEDEK